MPEFSKAEELRIWLEAHELASLNGMFAENDVDLEVLPELTEADLKELGLSLGQRRRLMKALRQTAAHRKIGPIPKARRLLSPTGQNEDN